MRAPGDMDVNGDLVDHGLAMTAAHAELAPGETCNACGRRKPYPKKDTSPDTKVIGKRVPVDELEAHEQVAVAAAEHLGVYGRPHWRYQLDTFAYARVLQDASLKDVGRAA